MKRALALGLLLSAGCGPARAAKAGRVSLMTFNVQNLFDTLDDPGTADETWLPARVKGTAHHKKMCASIQRGAWREQCLKLDWSERALQAKMKNLAAAILQAGGGRGPDVLVMEEVENLGILRTFNEQFLGPAGYTETVLLEGDDYRGIDVAMLSRLPARGEPRLHKIPFEGMSRAQLADSRAILEQRFTLPDGQVLAVYGVHLPAPFHPRKHREQALRFLAGFADGLPEDVYAVALGDFNIPADEDRDHRLLERFVGKHWLVSHWIGCRRCKGSTYYRKLDQWSFMDMILLSNNLGASAGPGRWTYAPDSVRTPDAAPTQLTPRGAPNGFHEESGEGVSDHLPVYLELLRRPNGR